MPLPAISPSGVSTAFQYGTQTSGGPGFTNIISAFPPDVNPPIIFEPGPDFTGGQTKVVMVVTGPGPNWGGAQIWASADGSTYGQIGTVYQGGVQGLLTAGFPTHSDPDTVDTLSVDVSMSGNQIVSGSTTDADLGITAAVLQKSSGAFELIGYSSVTLTAVNMYDIDTYIRRGIFGSTIQSFSTSDMFGLINGNIFSQVITPILCGKTVFFKFLSFNAVGGQIQSLADVPVYPHTIMCSGLSPVGPGTGNCAVVTVLAGSACCVDLGSVLECDTGVCDLGFVGDGVVGLCIDMGVIGT